MANGPNLCRPIGECPGWTRVFMSLIWPVLRWRPAAACRSITPNPVFAAREGAIVRGACSPLGAWLAGGPGLATSGLMGTSYAANLRRSGSSCSSTKRRRARWPSAGELSLPRQRENRPETAALGHRLLYSLQGWWYMGFSLTQGAEGAWPCTSRPSFWWYLSLFQLSPGNLSGSQVGRPCASKPIWPRSPHGSPAHGSAHRGFSWRVGVLCACCAGNRSW